MTTTSTLRLPASRVPLPPPRDGHESKLLDRLRGARASASWLPADLHADLTAARDRHLDRLGAVMVAMESLRALDRSFAAEDSAYLLAIKNAAASGAANPADDRTGQAEREAQMEGKLERLWAEVELLAEVVADAEELLLELEPQLCTELRQRAAAADDEAAQLRRRLTELEREAIVAERASQWVIATNTGRGGPLLSSQPFPSTNFDPQHVQRLGPSAFERTWQEHAA